MEELDYFHAVILGLVQAVTEFLPVSSSGHLAITQQLMHLQADAPQMLLFDLATHVGTLGAVVLVFRQQVKNYLRRLLCESSRTWSKPRYAWRIAGLGVCASIPTAIIGLILKDDFKSAFARPTLIAAGLALTGMLLAITPLFRRGRRGWKQFNFIGAVIVGIGQGLAILPGVSRSGTTICLATYLGLRRRWAAQFSFFIFVPAVLGATAIQLKDTVQYLPLLNWGPMLVGTLVSLVVGYGALKLLLSVVQRAKLHYFALYCWMMALLIGTGAL